MHLKPAPRHRGKLVPILLGALVAYFWFRPPAWVETRQDVPGEVHFTTLDGRTLTLADLRGKVVLVNFWATWCPYCRHEMPAIARFWQDHRDRGFEVVAASVEDDPVEVAAYLAQEGLRFPATLASVEMQQAFGGVSRLPTSYLLDRQGVIRHKIQGQVYYGRLKSLVEPLLAGAP